MSTSSAPLVPPRLGEAGRIRLGAKKTNVNGKEYPARLEQFRLTSAHRDLLERASGLYGGGDPQPWVSGAGEPGWELFTDSNELHVAVVLLGEFFSQSYEEWRGGLCVRRETEPFEMTDGDPAKLVTRLNVLLPDLGTLGLWRMETGGWYAAAELAGARSLLMLARQTGVQMVRGTLKLEQRTRKLLVAGAAQTRRFVVPVLTPELGPLMDRIIEAGLAQGAAQLEQSAGSPPQLAPLAGPQVVPPVPAAQVSGSGDEALSVRGRQTARALPTRTGTPGRVENDGQRGQDRQRRSVLPGRATTPEVAAGPPAAASGTRSAQARDDASSSRAPAAGQPAADDWLTETVNGLFTTMRDATRFLARHPDLQDFLADVTTTETREARLRAQSRENPKAQQAIAALRQEFAKPTAEQPTLGGGS